MISKITFLVTLATYIGIIVYYNFVLKRVITGPIGLVGTLILISPILLAFIIGIVVIIKNTDAKPFLNVIVYIVLTIGFLWTTDFVSDTISEKKYAASKIQRKGLYEEVSEKGERLIDIEVGVNFELYYFNDKLYEVHFSNDEIENVFVCNPELWKNTDENDYIKVYEVNEKYVLMLAKRALDTFDRWMIYMENVGYMYLGECYKTMYIIENNEYTILDKDIHTKIQEGWRK
ncbi:MAG: hypothetical protein FWE63_00750 [Bacteroidales bacterium]|nr:hypothetical protein [Bacteroidales bacterium]